MNEDIKQRPNRCPHMNCAVVHTGQCNFDMTEYCFQCRQSVLNQSTDDKNHSKTNEPFISEKDLFEHLGLGRDDLSRFRKAQLFADVRDLLKQQEKWIARQEKKQIFRAWDGEKWHYNNIFLSHDGKLWLRYNGRKLKEVDWKLEFNYKQDE